MEGNTISDLGINKIMKKTLLAIILIITPFAKGSCPNVHDGCTRSAVEASIRFSAVERYNQTSSRGDYREGTHNIDVFLMKGKELQRNIQRNMPLNDEKLYWVVCVSDRNFQQNKSNRLGGGVFYAIFDSQTLELLKNFRTR